MKAKKNSGFTLVELIVVIAIMAVAVGAGTYTMHLINSARAKQTAEKIKTSIEDARQQAMAHGTASVTIYRNADNEIWVKKTVNNNPVSDEKAGSASVIVKYSKDGAIPTEISDTASTWLTLTYKGASGTFSGLACDTISITGLGKDYTITCYELTGKIEME